MTCLIQCAIELLIHYQISTVQPLKFRNGYVIALHTLQWVELFMHAGIKIDPY